MMRERPLARRLRRVLVVIAVVSIIGLIFWGMDSAFGVAAFIVYCAVMARLGAAVGRPFRADEHLDERQRAARDRVHRVAYTVMSVLLLFALVPALLLDGTMWPSVDGRTFPLVTLALLAVVHASLPWAILAWTEPDPIPLEESLGGAS